MAEIHIPGLAPDVLFTIGPVPVTNTVMNVWLALLIFLGIGLMIKRKIALRPTKFQNGFEYILELLFPYFDQVTEDRKKTIRFLPIVGTIFFFILVSNWLSLLPGTGSISLGETSVFRPANTDLNLTLAMALVSVFASHVFAFVSIGVFTQFGKFIQIVNVIKSIPKGPVAIFQAIVEFAVGIIEIVSEIAKVLSLSLRLFGNIFAGEILISVMMGLVSAVVPGPFMLLELLVGLIQASVFAMLTLVYLSVNSQLPHRELEEAHA
jgi:F-type H+-transporting ATPase subunit a